MSCNVWLFDDGEHVKQSLGMKLARLLSLCLRPAANSRSGLAV